MTGEITARDILRGLWTVVTTRRVVQYDAVDYEHGPVEIEVRANRFTGRRRRFMWSRGNP
jgi:hypothetical protein